MMNTTTTKLSISELEGLLDACDGECDSSPGSLTWEEWEAATGMTREEMAQACPPWTVEHYADCETADEVRARYSSRWAAAITKSITE